MFLLIPVKPYFISEPHDVTVFPDQSVKLECRVGGEPTPKILWHRDSGEMPIGRVRLLDDKTLSIEHVTLDDEGVYVCDADNPVGSVSARATITVHGKLYI